MLHFLVFVQLISVLEKGEKAGKIFKVHQIFNVLAETQEGLRIHMPNPIFLLLSPSRKPNEMQTLTQ